MPTIRTINLEGADSVAYRSKDRMLEIIRPGYAEFVRLPNSSYVVDAQTYSIRFRNGSSTVLILEFGDRTHTFTHLSDLLRGEGFARLDR